jgi:hypothetical protein
VPDLGVQRTNPWGTLILGVLCILGLLYISALAISGPSWMGVLFGVIELVLAWRVSPPPGATVLRAFTGMMGVLMILAALTGALS